MEEIWKDVVGYEGLYQVSTLGKVKSMNYRHTKQEAIIKCHSVGKGGYMQVLLCRNGVKKFMYVHKLVAQAFLDNPNQYKEVNHINECKLDNSVINLEWCTRKYNVNYGENAPAHRRDIKVICVETERIFPSASAAGKELGISHSHILKCCKGTRKTTGGYHWRFVEA